MVMQPRRTMLFHAQEQVNEGLTERSRHHAPVYRCPGCHIALMPGGATLEHFNGCTALRELIAVGGSQYFARGAASRTRNGKLIIDDAAQKEKEKVMPQLVHWKVHGPVVSVPAETAELVNVEPPALIKRRKRKSRLRANRLKPHPLLDYLIDIFSLDNDAALAEKLQVGAPIISRIRCGKMPVGPSILMRMHEASDIPISRLRALLPDTTRYTEPTEEVNEPQEHY